MKDPTSGDERLGKLLDGRLDEHERAEMLARIAESDDDYEVFADAAAILRAMEEEDARASGAPFARTPQVSAAAGPRPVPVSWDTGTGETDTSVAPLAGTGPASPVAVPREPPAEGVIPIQSAARGWRGPGARWLAVAAVLAALALVPVLRSRWGGEIPGGSVSPTRLAVLLEERGGAGLPAGWTESRPWGTTRGAGDPLTPEALAVRAGVLLMDLELASRARDSASIARLAGEVGILLEDLNSSGRVVRKYEAVERLAGAAPEVREDSLAQGWRGVSGILNADLVRLGAWAEAGRLAAARRDAAFFRSEQGAAALERAAALPALAEPARAAVERVRSATRAGEVRDWAALQSDLEELLRALGG